MDMQQLAEEMRLASQAILSGADPIVVRERFLERTGLTMQDAVRALEAERIRQQEAAAPDSTTGAPPQSMSASEIRFGDLLRSAGQEFLLGFGDEVAGAISALRGGGFQPGRQAFLRDLQRFAEEHPSASRFARGVGIAGSLAVPGGAVAGSVRGARAAGAAGRILSPARTGAVAGGLFGALEGVGRAADAPGVEDEVAARVRGAAQGGVAGGLFGGALGAVASPLVSAGRFVRDRTRLASRQLDIIGEVAERGGPEDIRTGILGRIAGVADDAGMRSGRRAQRLADRAQARQRDLAVHAERLAQRGDAEAASLTRKAAEAEADLERKLRLLEEQTAAGNSRAAARAEASAQAAAARAAEAQARARAAMDVAEGRAVAAIETAEGRGRAAAETAERVSAAKAEEARARAQASIEAAEGRAAAAERGRRQAEELAERARRQAEAAKKRRGKKGDPDQGTLFGAGAATAGGLFGESQAPAVRLGLDTGTGQGFIVLQDGTRIPIPEPR